MCVESKQFPMRRYVCVCVVCQCNLYLCGTITEITRYVLLFKWKSRMWTWTIQTDIVNWIIRINIEFHESIVMFCVLCQLTRTKHLTKVKSSKTSNIHKHTHEHNSIDRLMPQFLTFESLIWEAFVFCKYLQINWGKWSYSFVHHQTLCRERERRARPRWWI